MAEMRPIADDNPAAIHHGPDWSQVRRSYFRGRRSPAGAAHPVPPSLRDPGLHDCNVREEEAKRRSSAGTTPARLRALPLPDDRPVSRCDQSQSRAMRRSQVVRSNKRRVPAQPSRETGVLRGATEPLARLVGWTIPPRVRRQRAGWPMPPRQIPRLETQSRQAQDCCLTHIGRPPPKPTKSPAAACPG